MTIAGPSASESNPTTLRLLWPQWQGATPENITALIPELPLAAAQTGYSIGSSILGALLPATDGPVLTVPVSSNTQDFESTQGIFAREAVLSQLTEAVGLIQEASPAKIVTLGGECSVSVAPFAHLAARYGDDLAIVWLDAHADCTLPDDAYDGYHAMALSHLIGKGDRDIVGALPATIAPSRVALAGVHAWTDWDLPNAREWGIQSFSAEDLNRGTETLLTWLEGTGCSKVAVHLDLDVVDSNDIVLGLGMEPGGLSREALIRTVTDLTTTAELVGVTVAEYVPRQVIAVQEILNALPLPK
ncbi:arginase family protein [Arthrobacter sp. StoSoilB20]|uniref:arginase family protein n=1 Tax=Arthrobacter sp. StoSoilB20 TaxID=2830995 RepID=UPI001CC4C78E|nr:arginase family protein [Arthrobacter sp. StoSoilB20]BCW58612.1 arginase [Arthrobacter sp. StoSoilB20]